MVAPIKLENRFKECVKEAVSANAICPNPKNDLEKDNLYKHMDNLKMIIGDFRIVDHMDLNERIITCIYISKKILDDIWENLAGDSTFGFEVIIESNSYGELQKNLFLFLDSIIYGKESSTEYLINTLNSYSQLLFETDKKILGMP